MARQRVVVFILATANRTCELMSFNWYDGGSDRRHTGSWGVSVLSKKCVGKPYWRKTPDLLTFSALAPRARRCGVAATSGQTADPRAHWPGPAGTYAQSRSRFCTPPAVRDYVC